MKIIFDTNIIIDLFQKREPFFNSAKELFDLVRMNEFNGILTANSFCYIYYLTRKQLHNEISTRYQLRILSNIFNVADVLEEDIKNALYSNLSDFEDAVIVEIGKRLKVDGIITRNIRHFKNSEVPIFTPEQFLNYLEAPN